MATINGDLLVTHYGYTLFYSEKDVESLYDDPESATSPRLWPPSGRIIVPDDPIISGPMLEQQLISRTNTTLPTVDTSSYPDPTPEDFQISKYYRLSELSSQTGGGGRYPIFAQHGLTRQQIVSNLSNLAINLLDKLVDKYGKNQMNIPNAFRKANAPEDTTSGYISKHELGMAVDIRFVRMNDDQFFSTVLEIANTFDYDQIIIQYEPKNQSRWMHISYIGPYTGGIAQPANPKIMTYNDSLRGVYPYNDFGYAPNVLIKYGVTPIF